MDDEPTKADERRLADLIAGNSRTEGELAAQGVRLGMDAVTQLQLRTLLRLLIPHHIDQMAWDLAYQESVREGLAEVAAQVKQQRNGSRLLVPNGAKVPPNLKG